MIIEKYKWHWPLLVMSALCLQACSQEPAQMAEQVETAAVPVETPTMDFAARMEEISRDYFLLRPETATYFGVPDEKAGAGTMGRLGQYSSVGEFKRRAGLKAILDRLAAIDRGSLNDGERISLELVETVARNAFAPSQIVDYGVVLGDYGVWFNPYPVSHLTGPHVEIPEILEDKMAVRNPAEADAYLSRLEAYAAVLEDVTEKVGYDQALGVIPPDFSLERTISNLQETISGPAASSILVSSLSKKLAGSQVEGAAEYTQQAVSLVAEKIYPATLGLISTLETLLPLASHEAGVGRLPNGAEFYQAMITHQTDTTLTAPEIHEIGLAEVDRIHAEMDPLLNSIGRSEGTVGERMSDMLRDPAYIYPNTAEGKAELMADMAADLALADAKLPLWFGKLPDQEVEIRVVPPHREDSASGAYYDAPSMDGNRPGTYWIALADTATLPSYSLQTLTYHEANPGHHLQTILSLNDELPILNTIFYSNAAGEGWGLYAEYLAKEMGLYENDPVDDIGRLQAELHRAVRLVVDTGMHAMGWSREQAIEYSVAVEGIHVDEATAEIERYAVWPGQALGYKLGMLKILELRQQAQEQLGEAFDIRTFHDAVLEQGALPLDLMEAKIDSWISAQLAESQN